MEDMWVVEKMVQKPAEMRKFSDECMVGWLNGWIAG